MREDKNLQTPTPKRGDIENMDGGHVVPNTALEQAFTVATSPAVSLGLDPADSSTGMPQDPSSASSNAAVPKQGPGGAGGTDGGGRRLDRKSRIKETPLNESGLCSSLPKVQGFSCCFHPPALQLSHPGDGGPQRFHSTGSLVHGSSPALRQLQKWS